LPRLTDAGGGKGLLKISGNRDSTCWQDNLEGDVVAAKALREELKLGAKMTAKELEQPFI